MQNSEIGKVVFEICAIKIDALLMDFPSYFAETWITSSLKSRNIFITAGAQERILDWEANFGENFQYALYNKVFIS